ncbi:tyrosine--tRNA ligase [Boudabousia tangfeifanii]|uniref:Tyrosine--tRNA ligase n=1 Tax=Boudabousia tangfeifanii TaxID=1912795 RepID=A0A1D9MKQ5_9ACTO|nr:tyrosine--tRNA ligase [Boudabousia tangfeifanii]AOZ72740.1 tyrosine--tRNA ligase [Boudabousia tangfeifanii]
MGDVIDELEWRGLISQSTDLAALRELMAEGPITFYTGYDPTAASLHHGHLVQLIVMKHLQNAGHRPLALVGGATGLIGDPRMSGERTLNESEVVAQWAEKLKQQISRFLSFEGPAAARMVNNYDWTGDLTAIELLREVGKYFRLGTMIAKDTVARRLASDEGISFTEFSYQLLQANDFLQLYRRYGCVLQTGGNDQWGNLIGGTELIRKAEGKSVHVLTTPLITKADGTKFGKSEGGAIWLDPQMMSPYAFYQFWLQTEDADVERLLKVFTFLNQEEIAELVSATAENPRDRVGQKRLAYEVTTLVHGKEKADFVVAASKALFGSGDLFALDGDTLLEATASLPSCEVKLDETTLIDMLVDAGLEKGRGAARRTMSAGGAYLNGEKILDEEQVVSAKDVLPGNLVLFRKGRRSMAVGRVVS